MDCTDPQNFQVSGCCTTSQFDQCSAQFAGYGCTCTIMENGRQECAFTETDENGQQYVYGCPARCCNKGKGCVDECLDNPPETTTSSGVTTPSTTPSTNTDTPDTSSCPAGCITDPDDTENKSFFVRKEMLVVYAILMCMPLMIWFTGAPIQIKGFISVVIIITLGIYIPLVLLPKYKQA